MTLMFQNFGGIYCYIKVYFTSITLAPSYHARANEVPVLGCPPGGVAQGAPRQRSGRRRERDEHSGLSSST